MDSLIKLKEKYRMIARMIINLVELKENLPTGAKL